MGSSRVEVSEKTDLTGAHVVKSMTSVKIFGGRNTNGPKMANME
jgi:hypothetical protein